MKIKLWGVRGSLPCPATPEYLHNRLKKTLESFQKSNVSIDEFLNKQHPGLLSGYGGHTMCVEVQAKDKSLIIDAGSGLRLLGEQLMGGPRGLGQGSCDILMTHFHWDHLAGLPFFSPIFVPGNEIHFWAVQDDLEENIRRVFTKPNFPVDFESLGAKIHFHKLEKRKLIEFSPLQVTPYNLDHPDECWGYRFEYNGKAFAHCVDSEMNRISPKELSEDLPLYQNLDLAILDAQYTFIESQARINWGHASAPVGLDLAMRESIAQVLFVHHDPAASDEEIYNLELQTRDYYDSVRKDALRQNRELQEVHWQFAREGSIIEL